MLVSHITRDPRPSIFRTSVTSTLAIIVSPAKTGCRNSRFCFLYTDPGISVPNIDENSDATSIPCTTASGWPSSLHILLNFAGIIVSPLLPSLLMLSSPWPRKWIGLRSPMSLPYCIISSAVNIRCSSAYCDTAMPLPPRGIVPVTRVTLSSPTSALEWTPERPRADIAFPTHASTGECFPWHTHFEACMCNIFSLSTNRTSTRASSAFASALFCFLVHLLYRVPGYRTTDRLWKNHKPIQDRDLQTIITQRKEQQRRQKVSAAPVDCYQPLLLYYL